MFDPKAESIKKLIEKYKALFEFAIKQQEGTSLSTDQIKAIGKRVLNETLETAMDNLNVPIEERNNIKEQFEELIRNECPDMTFDTPINFDDSGFSIEK
jgi:hypothetical protein